MSRRVVRLRLGVEAVALAATAAEPCAACSCSASSPGMLAAAAFTMFWSSQPVFSVPWLKYRISLKLNCFALPAGGEGRSAAA